MKFIGGTHLRGGVSENLTIDARGEMLHEGGFDGRIAEHRKLNSAEKVHRVS
jgi:hypothetical protein